MAMLGHERHLLSPEFGSQPGVYLEGSMFPWFLVVASSLAVSINHLIGARKTASLAFRDQGPLYAGLGSTIFAIAAGIVSYAYSQIQILGNSSTGWIAARGAFPGTLMYASVLGIVSGLSVQAMTQWLAKRSK